MIDEINALMSRAETLIFLTAVDVAGWMAASILNRVLQATHKVVKCGANVCATAITDDCARKAGTRKRKNT